MSDYSNVKVYVGTYAKYNCGFIDGKWFTPADYDSYEDFIKALRDFHSDESDPEFMYQDAEYLPRGLYCESDFDEETFDYCKYVSENPENAYGAYCWVENFNDGWDADNFESSFMGEYDSAEDYCWQYIEDCGGISEAINRDTLEMYFDYENFGREIKMDLDEEDEWESQLLDMSDYDCGAEYIDSYGGIEQMNDSTIENYFDIESFARDCQFDGSFDYYDGCVFINYQKFPLDNAEHKCYIMVVRNKQK